jgi:hypothetical protein
LETLQQGIVQVAGDAHSFIDALLQPRMPFDSAAAPFQEIVAGHDEEAPVRGFFN